MNTDLRFALISHYLPPSRFGQPRVIYRLLQDIPADQYGLFSIHPYDKSKPIENHDAPWLQGPYFHIDSGFPFKQITPQVGSSSLWRTVYTNMNLFGALIKRSYAISRIVKQQGYNCIIACSGDPIDIPASFLAANRLKLPFFTYMFDDYGTQYKIIPLYQKFTSFWDRIIAKKSTGIIVTNEMLCHDYEKRASTVPSIVRNPLRELPEQNNYPWPFKKDEIRIVYTGSVYHVHEDAFARLVKVLDRCDQPVSLHLYCSVPTQDMPIFKNSHKVVHHEHVSDEEAMKLQETADILFLPLAFQSPTPEVIRTALPGKFAEYLASGRPILVHAPQECFVSWYCKKKQCAVVVDQDDENVLLEGINQIITNSQVRKQITKASQQAAIEEFSPHIAQTRFLECIDNSISTNRNNYKLSIIRYILKSSCYKILKNCVFSLVLLFMKMIVINKMNKIKSK